MNAKNMFRKLGQGFVRRDKFTNLLQTMSRETEEKEAARKKEIAEQARIDQTNVK